MLAIRQFHLMKQPRSTGLLAVLRHHFLDGEVRRAGGLRVAHRTGLQDQVAATPADDRHQLRTKRVHLGQTARVQQFDHSRADTAGQRQLVFDHPAAARLAIGLLGAAPAGGSDDAGDRQQLGGEHEPVHVHIAGTRVLGVLVEVLHVADHVALHPKADVVRQQVNAVRVLDADDVDQPDMVIAEVRHQPEEHAPQRRDQRTPALGPCEYEVV